MNMQKLKGLQAGIHAILSPGAEDGSGMVMPAAIPAAARLLDHSPELMDAADQVAAEQRGRVLIVAQQDGPCRWLLAQLRQQPPVPSFHQLAREGLFTLACLPSAPCAQADAGSDEEGGMFEWRSSEDKFDLLADELFEADLVLFVVAADPQAEPEAEPGKLVCDTRTFARLRASGTPVLPVLLQGERPAGESEALRRLLGVQPVLLSAPQAGWEDQAETGTETGAETATDRAQQGELLALIDRILSMRPRLSIPLAQEVPFCRRPIATRVIRTGAWMTALVGLEPIPIVDLPLQVALQWKVILQLAAIYGRPGLDVRSREMAGAVSVSVLMRMVTQQLLKFLPVVGWMLSGLLSGVSTLLIGHAFLRIYEYDRLLDVGTAVESAGAALQRCTRRALASLHNLHHGFATRRWRYVRRGQTPREGGRHA